VFLSAFLFSFFYFYFHHDHNHPPSEWLRTAAA